MLHMTKQYFFISIFKARQSIKEAECSDQGNPLNAYFDFKIALFEKNNDRGVL